MPLVSVPCPDCGASTYLSLPDGNRFVTTEPGEGDGDRTDLTEETLTCDDCGATFPALHGPADG
jgi:ribosomal protein S27AE